MIEIKKHGKFALHKYLTNCKKCGGEFYFTHGDYKGINGIEVTLSCPECGHIWSGKYISNIAWLRNDTKKEEK